MLSFGISSLEGNLQKYNLLSGLVEFSFNILHFTQLEYFYSDFVVYKADLNELSDLLVEDGNCIVPLDIVVETNIPLSSLSNEDMLLIRIWHKESPEKKKKVGECTISIFPSNAKFKSQYLTISGSQDTALLNWQEKLFNLSNNSLKKLTDSAIRNECKRLLSSGNALYLKVRINCIEYNNNSEEEKRIRIEDKSKKLIMNDSIIIQSKDFSIKNQSVTENASKVFRHDWKDRLMAVMNFAMNSGNSLTEKYFTNLLFKLEDSFIEKYYSLLCTGILYSKPAYCNSLISFALKNQRFSNFFFWFLNSNLSLINEKRRLLAEKLLINLTDKLKRIGSTDKLFQNQIHFIKELQIIYQKIRSTKYNRYEKETALRFLIGKKLIALFPLKHPLYPDIICKGIENNSILTFKSTQMPMKWNFNCNNSTNKTGIIFKYGDDLRQDEFCLNFIRFLNDLWLDRCLNLEIVTYKVLPIGECAGFIELVEAQSLTSILENNENSIIKYLHHLASTNGESIDAIKERFLKSAAGYSALTFLLGVGDRHLDNLMIDYKGRFFHIDYAFIFGSDPKPLPPAFKLTAEVIDALDGTTGAQHSSFMSIFCYALEIARENFDTLFAFIQMYQLSELECLFETINELRQYLKNRLKPNESIQDAMSHWIKVIKASSNSLFPQLIDTFHKWTQDWRD